MKFALWLLFFIITVIIIRFGYIYYPKETNSVFLFLGGYFVGSKIIDLVNYITDKYEL